jgi:hypothetical protein
LVRNAEFAEGAETAGLPYETALMRLTTHNICVLRRYGISEGSASILVRNAEFAEGAENAGLPYETALMRLTTHNICVLRVFRVLRDD